MHPQELANLALALAIDAEVDGMTGTAAALREIGCDAWFSAKALRDLCNERLIPLTLKHASDSDVEVLQTAMRWSQGP